MSESEVVFAFSPMGSREDFRAVAIATSRLGRESFYAR